ncbi:MAG: LamG domain-containing protein [Phycisphaerae bacterium]|nr:LamG domain-containing protein [Phycisphaerae bacterium]
MAGWGKTDTVAAGYRWLAAYGTASTSQAMFIGMNGTSLYGGGYGDDVLLSDFWEVGVWHHICLTYDGTAARLYADGIQVASEAKTWDLALGRAHIGRQVNNAAEFWDGVIDDVRIYNRVLTPEEIQQAMRGDPLLAWGPSPADGSTPDVLIATPLSWSPGDNASEHDVYFGTDKDAVTDADASDTMGIYRGRQSGTVYILSEGLGWGLC